VTSARHSARVHPCAQPRGDGPAGARRTGVGASGARPPRGRPTATGQRGGSARRSCEQSERARSARPAPRLPISSSGPLCSRPVLSGRRRSRSPRLRSAASQARSGYAHEILRTSCVSCACRVVVVPSCRRLTNNVRTNVRTFVRTLFVGHRSTPDALPRSVDPGAAGSARRSCAQPRSVRVRRTRVPANDLLLRTSVLSSNPLWSATSGLAMPECLHLGAFAIGRRARPGYRSSPPDLCALIQSSVVRDIGGSEVGDARVLAQPGSVCDRATRAPWLAISSSGPLCSHPILCGRFSRRKRPPPSRQAGSAFGAFGAGGEENANVADHRGLDESAEVRRRSPARVAPNAPAPRHCTHDRRVAISSRAT
jgi:hypothetical protein